MELGGNRFLRKPATAKELFEALSGAVVRDRRHPPAAPARVPELELMKEYSQRLVAKLEERNLELAERTEQLRALADRLERAREEERTAISREIHDEFGEALTGFKLGLGWIRNRLGVDAAAIPREQVLGKIESLAAMVDATAGRVRNLCASLRPSVLDDFGLLSALQWQAKEFQTRTGIQCEVTERLGETMIRDEHATGLFRMFQEILTNVARHAEAAKVCVTLAPSGTNLVLCVSDDGRGIRPEEIAGHQSLGLLGMRERVALLGGKLDIRGVAGEGTTVLISIPLDLAVAPPADDVPPQ
jgi:signal transduction histidine kinase